MFFEREPEISKLDDRILKIYAWFIYFFVPILFLKFFWIIFPQSSSFIGLEKSSIPTKKSPLINTIYRIMSVLCSLDFQGSMNTKVASKWADSIWELVADFSLSLPADDCCCSATLPRLLLHNNKIWENLDPGFRTSMVDFQNVRNPALNFQKPNNINLFGIQLPFIAKVPHFSAVSTCLSCRVRSNVTARPYSNSVYTASAASLYGIRIIDLQMKIYSVLLNYT